MQSGPGLGFSFGLRRPGVLWKLQSTEDDGGRIPKEGNASGLLDEAFH